MADVKIRVFREDSGEPTTTVTIPGSVLDVAARLMPRRAADALRQEGIDLEELIELSKKPGLHGTLVQVDDHEKGERILVSIE